MKYKIILSLMALGILSFLVRGSSAAYFTSNTAITSNIEEHDLATFKTGAVKISVAEGENLSSSSSNHSRNRRLKWEITNNSVDAIRLKVRVIEKGQKEGVTLISRNRWIQGKDGEEDYYYYDGPVEPEEMVVFPLRVSFDTWKTITNYGINIEAEAIQASNNAIDYGWENHPIENK